jgi:hypothetical protein
MAAEQVTFGWQTREVVEMLMRISPDLKRIRFIAFVVYGRVLDKDLL